MCNRGFPNKPKRGYPLEIEQLSLEPKRKGGFEKKGKNSHVQQFSHGVLANFKTELVVEKQNKMIGYKLLLDC